MKSLMLLWQVLLQELGKLCCTSTILDLKKVEKRFEHEGISLFTLTLPAYAKEFEKALEQKQVDPTQFSAWQRNGGLPLFLGGFLDRVFDRRTGCLLEEPCVESILAVRQLTLLYSKILIECSESRREDAIQGYLQCEMEMKVTDVSIPEDRLQAFSRMSALLFRDVFTEMDFLVHNGDVRGKHGPGKTADRLMGNQKYDQTEWPERMEAVFPIREHTAFSFAYDESYASFRFLEPGQERPVKVTLVPKTPKAPRIIVMEPTCMQYMQQGLMELFVPFLEADKTVSGMIGFTRQGPNQVLAREGSLYGKLATLDLSEASDRVSNRYVREMLKRWPSLSAAVDATRSRKAVVPGGSVVTLAKFASMGSALCFPVEAMVFLTIVFMGIQDRAKHQITRKEIARFAGSVRVYGDDIIVPVETVPFVITELEAFGLKVNVHKSFWNGKFRESCGKDYYDGTDVSVVKCRRVLPTSHQDVLEIISAVSLRNQLYYAGYEDTVEYLDRMISPLLWGYYPRLEPDMNSVAFTGEMGSGSPLLGRHDFVVHQPQKIDTDLQSPLVKGWEVSSKPPVSKISGEGALLKYFLKRGDLPSADRKHLERSGRPETVDINLRYRSPH